MEAPTELFREVSRISTPKAIEDQVKHLITAGCLVPGDRLPSEREFAERLSVSRSTLREALRSLTEQGVVTPYPGAGWAIQPNQMTVASNLAVYFHLAGVTFDDVVNFRLANEPVTARFAAQRHTPEDLRAIEGALDDMAGTFVPRAFLDADSVFHALIASAAHNVMFSFSTYPTMSLLEDVRLAVVEQQESIPASQTEHEHIVDAIRQRRGEEAESAMRRHLELFALRAQSVGAGDAATGPGPAASGGPA